MRKIIEKKDKKLGKQVMVGLILIAIMFLSVLGYSFESQQKEDTQINNINYNGFEFQRQNDFWTLNFQNVNLVFKYNPNEVETIKQSIKKINNYNNKPLYIYSEDKEAEYEIARNIYPFVLRIQDACLEGEKCEENFPIKTCEDNFIIIKESNESKISQETNCLFIYGEDGNRTRMADAFLFKTLGIK